MAKGAPNIPIVLLDDIGFGVTDTIGGPVHTPTLSRLSSEGISYNMFCATSICSPTRAALLTGRNHQRVGSGTIAERAVNWDGSPVSKEYYDRRPFEFDGKISTVNVQLK